MDRAGLQRPLQRVDYGVGNHGGGPTRSNLDQIARLTEDGALPRLELASLRRFFDRLGGGAPRCAGSCSATRRAATRRTPGSSAGTAAPGTCSCEAEKWAAVADSLGLRPYPLAELSRGWKLVLFN